MAVEAVEAMAAAVPPPSTVMSDDDSLHMEGWAKRKRSKRHRLFDHSPTEEEYLALCLLMLARGEPDRRSLLPSSVSSDSPTKVEYKCSVCGKAFGSYQALGGHKTSHRIKPTSSGAEEAASAASTGSFGRLHQCSVCLKTFPSGQALGGHKRCHYEGRGAAVESEGITSSSHKGLDLNVQPLPDDFEFENVRHCLQAAAAEMEEEEEEVQSPLGLKKPRLLIPA